jgi:hypothetical protein
MAGMEGLGRVFNYVESASGAGISLKNCSGITYKVYTGSVVPTSLVVTVAPTFGGSYVSPGNIINHYYVTTAAAGTAAWTRVAMTASDTILAAALSITNVLSIPIFGSQIPDPNAYIKLTATAGTGVLVHAIVHDLTSQRKAANLAILGA